MGEDIIEKIPLNNGLTLDVYDKSRRVAGDRWLVHFVGAVTIDIERYYPDSESAPALNAVKGALGDTVCYCVEKKSHFVDQSEKDEVFKRLQNDFLNANLHYLSSPAFPPKLILRRYGEKTAMYGQANAG